MFLQVAFSVPLCTVRTVTLYSGYIMFIINGVNGRGCDGGPISRRGVLKVQIGHVICTRSSITKCLWLLQVLQGCDLVVVHVYTCENTVIYRSSELWPELRKEL